ncbi:Peroxisomal biogenesis factor 19 [Seiridium cupressi]|uniref:Pex19-domain-containing protein n=1 Tax=Seiridium unicorne TaxID=138068 RepID=A0ABR2UUC3_9PEZI
MSTNSSNPTGVGDKSDAGTTAEQVNAPVPDNVSDPDEDDLDDLDDMLDEFSSVKLDPKPTAVPPATKPAGPPASTSTKGPTIPTLTTDVPAIDPDDFSEEEFQRQLQAGMAELMGDFDKNLNTKQPEMQAQFESIFKGLGVAGAAGSDAEPTTSSASKSESAAKPGADQIAADLSENASFQETIRKTMARMQASGDQATAAAAAEGSEDDFIAEMMKAMKDLPGAADGSEEDFSKVLMGMMEQLTNKDILYDPMKELNEKFPAWMEKNGKTLKKEDKDRYEEQRRLVGEMVAKFEEPTYKDDNAADREYIVDRMQKKQMQAAGSPPPDLVGDMPSAKEVLDGPDDNCTPQ